MTKIKKFLYAMLAVALLVAVSAPSAEARCRPGCRAVAVVKKVRNRDRRPLQRVIGIAIDFATPCR